MSKSKDFLNQVNEGNRDNSFQSVADKHQRKIARDTMKMHCAGARIMGGMSHIEAAKILNCKTPSDCTCGDK